MTQIWHEPFSPTILQSSVPDKFIKRALEIIKTICF